MREGTTRLEVLAAVAHLERKRDTPPRQKHVTEAVTVTKGAVSNACTQLVEEGLLDELDGGQYRVSENGILVWYKEHLESFLVRESATEPFERTIEWHNDVRSRLKQELRRIVTDDGDGRRDLLYTLILEVLIASREFREVQTIRELRFAIDQQIQLAATHIVTNPTFDGINSGTWEAVRPLILVAIVLERGHGVLARLCASHPELADYLPGEPPAERLADQLTVR